MVAIVRHEVTFKSRIRFRLDPVSKELARALLAQAQKQVLSEPPDGLEVWPLDEENAVMELSGRGPMLQYNELEWSHQEWSHQQNTDAMAEVLAHIKGFAEIVSQAEFRGTDPRI